MFQNNTPGLLSTFRACVDWLGNLRAENESLNDDISSDAVRIASLELALRQANIKAMVWQVKAEDLQDKLDAANGHIDNLLETSGTMAVRCEGLEDRLEAAQRSIAVLDAQYEGAEAALKAARAEIEELEANEETNWPLVSYALARKASLAKYDAKRRAK